MLVFLRLIFLCIQTKPFLISIVKNVITRSERWFGANTINYIKVIIFWLENGKFEFSRKQYIFYKTQYTRVVCRILLPFLKYAFHLTISFHYCSTQLKFDMFYRQNRGGSKLTRGSSQVNLTLIETETRVQAYFATPF